MAGMAVPLIEGAAMEFGPLLMRIGAALLGGAGTASLSGDAADDDIEARASAHAVPRTAERCERCPPESGLAVKRFHSMNAAPREYQGRITGRPYSVAEGWSEEWAWLNIDFDGFVPGQCLLQEAKGNYDQFLDGSIPAAYKFFKGFESMEAAAEKQASLVRAKPPTRLMWYFQTPLAQSRMMLTLRHLGIPSIVHP
ncbi:hypothetical protein BCC1697_004020 [Burkholderia gladioli]